MTDAWSSYTALGRHGFKHQIVNHTVGFVDPDIPNVCYIYDVNCNKYDIERMQIDTHNFIDLLSL